MTDNTAALREAAQQALTALETYVQTYNDYWERGMDILEPIGDAAVSKLRAALAASPPVQQEPDVNVFLGNDGEVEISALWQGVVFDASISREGRVAWAYHAGQYKDHQSSFPFWTLAAPE